MKKLAIMVGVAVLAGLVMAPMAGAWMCGPGPGGVNANWNTWCPKSNLYFFQKDPATGRAIPGAWGTMNYSLWGTQFQFTFDGQGLQPNVSYTLIYAPGAYPFNGLIALASGTADATGILQLTGPVTTGNMPNSTDPRRRYGAQMMLVLTADVDAAAKMMINWNPADYLFANCFINYQKRAPQPQPQPQPAP